MGNSLRLIGAMIWVSIFICLCLIVQSAATLPDTSDPLNRVKEFHSNFITHDQQSGPSLMQHNLSDNGAQGTGLETFPPDLMPHSQPMKQHIAMDNSHPEQQVQDMYALNTNMQRDIVFDDTQRGDPIKKSLKNSMDITVDGNRQGQPNSNHIGPDGSSDDMGIENFVDNAVSSQQHDGPAYYQSKSGNPGQQRLGNYMNIDVSGINVQATNTVEGGSAVATSNIEIKPVQIINCPPEVDEKLK
jgi:hypothetical protein